MAEEEFEEMAGETGEMRPEADVGLQAVEGEETTIASSESSQTPQQSDFDKARAEVASAPEAEKKLSSSGLERAEQKILSESRQDAAKVIEAALFLSNKPLSYADMALIAKTSVKKAREVAERLSAQYAERQGAIELVCDAQQATMQVRGEFLAPVAQLSKNLEMSRKATRMLALVAKKGRFLQSELKKYFRGDIYAYIAELKQLGYVSSEKSGNTRVLRTTEKFRENFQLGSTGAQALEAAAAKAGEARRGEEARKEEEVAAAEAEAEVAAQEAKQKKAVAAEAGEAIEKTEASSPRAGGGEAEKVEAAREAVQEAVAESQQSR